LQVLQLQTALEQLVALYDNGSHVENVTFNDICFKPLAPDNNHCTVNSVLQYFQNSNATLHNVTYDDSGFYVVADHVIHFQACAR